MIKRFAKRPYQKRTVGFVAGGVALVLVLSGALEAGCIRRESPSSSAVVRESGTKAAVRRNRPQSAALLWEMIKVGLGGFDQELEEPRANGPGLFAEPAV